MNANGAGSSGGDTAPPDEVLPSTTKNRKVGTIAHRPRRQRKRGRESEGDHEPRPAAQRQAAGERPGLEHGDEADDRRHEHQVEDVETARIRRRERVRVDHLHARIDGEDLLQQSRHGCAGGARHIERRLRRGEVEGGVDPLAIDRVARGCQRFVAGEIEAVLGDPLDRLHRARVPAGIADERGIDAAGHRVAERERVGRHEQRAHHDRQGGDHPGTLDRRPAVAAKPSPPGAAPARVQGIHRS